MVMLLVDMAVEHRDVAVRHQDVDDLRAVARGPIPLWIEIEQRPVREHDDARVARLFRQVVGQPLALRLAHHPGRIGHVVEHDGVQALVIERVVRGPEQLAECLARVQAGIVLARHQVYRTRTQRRDDVAYLRHAAAALGRVVGGMRQVAREHDEIGLARQCVDGRHGLGQRAARVRIRRPFEPPVRIGQLHEHKVLVTPRRPAGQRRCDHGTACRARQAQYVAPTPVSVHDSLLRSVGGDCHTGAARRLFPGRWNSDAPPPHHHRAATREW